MFFGATALSCLFLAFWCKIEKKLLFFFLNRRLVESRVSVCVRVCVCVCVLELEKRPSLSPEDLPIECMVVGLRAWGD